MSNDKKVLANCYELKFMRLRQGFEQYPESWKGRKMNRIELNDSLM